MIRKLVFVTSLVLFALSVGSAHSATRLALVIGNAAYTNVPELTNPKNDAEAMSDKLASLGFEVIKGIDLDLIGMRKTVRNFVNKLDGAEIALFFYAGHGLQVNGQNYMAPVDATLSHYNDLEFETVPINLVLSAMERSSKTNLVFLDACRNNPLAVNLARSLGTRSASVGRGLASIGSGVGTLVSFSTEPGNVALDGSGKNSPYTEALVKYLGTPGEDIATTMKSVRRQVLKSTDGKQVPWEHSSLTGEVILRTEPTAGIMSKEETGANVAAGSTNRVDRETEFIFWNSVKDSNQPAAFEAYLRRYPNGVFADLASINLSLAKQRLVNGRQAIVTDNSTEIAYWKSIESGGGAVFFKSYLARYPDGLFVEIANLKLAAIDEDFKQKPNRALAIDGNGSTKVAVLTPPTAPVSPTAINEPLDRAGTRQVQIELNRLGCSAGAPDGLWGKGSRRALTNYRKHSGANLSSLEPTSELLERLQNTTAAICPVVVQNKRATKKRTTVTKRSSSRQKKRKTQPKQVAKKRPRRKLTATDRLDLGDPRDP